MLPHPLGYAAVEGLVAAPVSPPVAPDPLDVVGALVVGEDEVGLLLVGLEENPLVEAVRLSCFLARRSERLCFLRSLRSWRREVVPVAPAVEEAEDTEDVVVVSGGGGWCGTWL